MLRRIAYVETRDGTSKPFEQNYYYDLSVKKHCNNKVLLYYCLTQMSGNPTLNVEHNLEFDIDWNAMGLDDLKRLPGILLMHTSVVVSWII